MTARLAATAHARAELAPLQTARATNDEVRPPLPQRLHLARLANSPPATVHGVPGLIDGGVSRRRRSSTGGPEKNDHALFRAAAQGNAGGRGDRVRALPSRARKPWLTEHGERALFFSASRPSGFFAAGRLGGTLPACSASRHRPCETAGARLGSEIGISAAIQCEPASNETSH